MPRYDYRCDTCHYQFEAIQKYDDEPLEVCPACGSPLKKLVPKDQTVVYKGSGVYSTDHS